MNDLIIGGIFATLFTIAVVFEKLASRPKVLYPTGRAVIEACKASEARGYERAAYVWSRRADDQGEVP